MPKSQIKDNYKLFIRGVHDEITKCNEVIETSIKSLELSRDFLLSNSSYVNSYSSSTVEKILSGVTDIKTFRVRGSDKDLNYKIIFYTAIHLRAKSKYESALETRNKYSKFNLTHKEFSVILSTLNTEACRMLVTTGKSILLGKCGSLGLHLMSGNKQVIDWGLSIKNKKRIIAEGKTPLKYNRGYNNQIVDSNNGVPWIVYTTRTNIPYIYWRQPGTITFSRYRFVAYVYNHTDISATNLKDKIGDRDLFSMNLGLALKLMYYYELNPSEILNLRQNGI